VCCSVLQCAAVCRGVLQCHKFHTTHTDRLALGSKQHFSQTWAAAVCCSVLQSVAECCRVLQCVVVCCNVLQCHKFHSPHLERVALGLKQQFSKMIAMLAACRHSCVAVCCGVLRCVAACCSVFQCVAVWCSVLQCVAVCCSVLQ